MSFIKTFERGGFRMIEKKCPNCKSENLSDGKNDYLYSISENKEKPIQFCNDCHAEWFTEEDLA